ncbi:MAG TPA: hypothetical protein VFH17_01660, partial [Coriobacteriia bacterium]|nr:hypothetical protein [Coriobacteriia bacterium]
MSGRVSRASIVGALLKKELKAYSRDTVYLLLTLVVLIAIPILFLFLPDTVDETLTLGVAPPVGALLEDAEEALRDLGATEEQLARLDEAALAEQQEGLRFVEFETGEDLRQVVAGELEAWRAADGALLLLEPGADGVPRGAERL